MSAFLTAFQIATAVSEAIEQNYESTLPSGHSFLESWGMTEADEAALAEQELRDWEEEAKLSQRSFSEIAAVHHMEVENQLLADMGGASASGAYANLEAWSESELDAELLKHMQWPDFIDDAVDKVQAVSAKVKSNVVAKAKDWGNKAKAIGGKIDDGIQAVNRGVNWVGSKLDNVEEGLKTGLKKVTKATHTEFLNGAIDAGVSMAMTAGPLGQFRAIQAGINTAAAVSGGLRKSGVKGAWDAGKGALVDAAKNYVMNKIPGGKILEHAMSGPMGKMVQKMGKKALDSPAAKKLMAQSQKFLASKVMKSPLAKHLVGKVQENAGKILAKGKDMALGYVNNKIQEKTGINLNLQQGGKLGIGKKGKGLGKALGGVAKSIGKEAGMDFAGRMAEAGGGNLDGLDTLIAGGKAGLKGLKSLKGKSLKSIGGSIAKGYKGAGKALMKKGLAGVKEMGAAGWGAAKEQLSGQFDAAMEARGLGAYSGAVKDAAGKLAGKVGAKGSAAAKAALAKGQAKLASLRKQGKAANANVRKVQKQANKAAKNIKKQGKQSAKQIRKAGAAKKGKAAAKAKKGKAAAKSKKGKAAAKKGKATKKKAAAKKGKATKKAASKAKKGKATKKKAAAKSKKGKAAKKKATAKKRKATKKKAPAKGKKAKKTSKKAAKGKAKGKKKAAPKKKAAKGKAKKATKKKVRRHADAHSARSCVGRQQQQHSLRQP